MPMICPYNAEERSPERPDIAEEISVFHWAILRHSRGGATNADLIPIRDSSPQQPA
jgi:hypothetical protein